MQLEFRPANPTDADAAVPLIYSSGPAAFDYVFADRQGGAAQSFLDHAFRDGAGEFGCRKHTVVTRNDQIVGVGACYTGETSLADMLHAIRQIWSFYGPMRSPGVIRRGLKLEQQIKPPQGTMNYIGHLGVAAQWRGRGIGRRLIEFFLEVGRQAHRPKAVLDVSVENPRAQALYERLGFQTVTESISTIPDVPAHRRMELPL